MEIFFFTLLFFCCLHSECITKKNKILLFPTLSTSSNYELMKKKKLLKNIDLNKTKKIFFSSIDFMPLKEFWSVKIILIYFFKLSVNKIISNIDFYSFAVVLFMIHNLNRIDSELNHLYTYFFKIHRRNS